jgi:uracil-DNA glycosylase
MTSRQLIQKVAGLQFANTFNPYSTRCAVHDQEDAPRLRSKILYLILERAKQENVDSIWIGRDLGFRGGRRTGLALTDDFHVAEHANRWGVTAERFTNGDAVAERTAAVIWRLLSQISVPVFLWNVFPLHPHEPNNPFTNRRHNVEERAAGESILAEIIELLRPRRLVALGNDAADTVRRIAGSQEIVLARHPSYGGQTQFEVQMRNLYGIRDDVRQGKLLQ